MKLALIFLAVLLTAVILPPPARAQDKATLDLLLKKGIISQQDYDDVMQGSQEPFKGPAVQEPVKDETPAVSTETRQPAEKGPAPIGSYKDLERIPGGIENLRKSGYRNVFTTLDSLLKRSERLSVGIVALRVAYQAENVDRKPSSSSVDTAERQNTTRDENGFRIRTAELYITGRLTPWSTYYYGG